MFLRQMLRYFLVRKHVLATLQTNVYGAANGLPLLRYFLLQKYVLSAEALTQDLGPANSLHARRSASIQ